MVNYLKKKLSYHQVLRVISTAPKDGPRMMRQIPRPFAIDGVPEGHYCVVEDGILLPKRRRGEKFSVAYTQVHEKEF